VIFHVDDVDALHQRALAAGYHSTTAPRDAEWGERFFHLTDPDGHELSFARPLQPPTPARKGTAVTRVHADASVGIIQASMEVCGER
jgi:hypothetical protein